MNLQEFKQIFCEHGGSVFPDQIEQLAEFAPDLILGVKVGYGSRFTTTAKNFKLDLEKSEGGKAKALGLAYGDVVYLV